MPVSALGSRGDWRLAFFVIALTGFPVARECACDPACEELRVQPACSRTLTIARWAGTRCSKLHTRGKPGKARPPVELWSNAHRPQNLGEHSLVALEVAFWAVKTMNSTPSGCVA